MSEGGGDGRVRSVWRRVVRDRWRLAVLAGLTLVLGATSFNVHEPERRHVDSVFHLEQGWRIFITRGQGVEDEIRTDPNIFNQARRILATATVVGISTATSLPVPYTFSLVRLTTIFLALLAFHAYLAGWVGEVGAWLGVFFACATLPLTFAATTGYEVLNDFPELLTFTLGMWFLREGRFPALVLVIAMGTLNRETSVLLVAVVALHGWFAVPRGAWAARVASAGAAWFLPNLAISAWLAPGVRARWAYDPTDAMQEVITHNLEGLVRFTQNLNPFNNYLFFAYLFGAFWVLPFARWRAQPMLLRCALAVVPLHLLLCSLVRGFINEPRLLFCLYPIVVPAALLAWMPALAVSNPQDSATR